MVNICLNNPEKIENPCFWTSEGNNNIYNQLHTGAIQKFFHQHPLDTKGLTLGTKKLYINNVKRLANRHLNKDRKGKAS